MICGEHGSINFFKEIIKIEKQTSEKNVLIEAIKYNQFQLVKLIADLSRSNQSIVSVDRVYDSKECDVCKQLINMQINGESTLC